MPLFNIFSNIWVYLSNYEINNNENKKEFNEFMYDISKIKQIHHINKVINIDNEIKFWRENSNFINEIQEQIILNKQKQMIKIYNKYSTVIQKYIVSSEKLLLISFSNHEFIIGLYLFFLKKIGNLNLDKSRNTLLSKFTGLNIELSDNMKKLLYLVCK